MDSGADEADPGDQAGRGSERQVGDTDFSHMLQALDSIDFKGVMHRDVKPKNILFARSSARHCFQLADFGLCEVIARTDSQSGPRLSWSREALENVQNAVGTAIRRNERLAVISAAVKGRVALHDKTHLIRRCVFWSVPDSEYANIELVGGRPIME